MLYFFMRVVYEIRSLCQLQATSSRVQLRTFSVAAARLANAPKTLLQLPDLVKPDDHQLAENWINGFQQDDIPKDAWETSYSRSSGPGGQVSRMPRHAEQQAEVRRWLTDSM
jgi:hypothetical protein